MKPIRITGVRASDPITSHLGALDVEVRDLKHRPRLLLAYSTAVGGLTADEAAEQTGLLRACYWKRCSELRELGFTEPIKIGGATLTRRASSGSKQMVCRITEAGREELRAKGLL